MSKSKILVTGANGQLGRELQVIAASNPQFEFIFLSKEDLPINQGDAVNKFFAATVPQYCINCAAYTAVDKAETDRPSLPFLAVPLPARHLFPACHLPPCTFNNNVMGHLSLIVQES